MVFIPPTQVCEISVNIKDTKHIMSANQTGQYPVVSIQRNRYIMVLCKTDKNLILVEPIKQNIRRNVQVMQKTDAKDEQKRNQN